MEEHGHPKIMSPVPYAVRLCHTQATVNSLIVLFCYSTGGVCCVADWQTQPGGRRHNCQAVQ